MKKEIVVLGGGSAGWVTALFIKQVWPNCNLTVIEDPNTPPIVTGESGPASLNKLYNFLEINFTDWVTSVNAMPKLGGKLVDWNGIGTSFVHGLIPDWYDLNYKSQHPEFGGAKDFIACAIAENISTDDLFYNATLQNLGKLPITPSSDGSLFNVLSLPMWHFDSRANADYMKKIGLSRNIKLIEGKYIHCTKDNRNNIVSLNLDTDLVVSGDWFFDCSGLARLLVHKELCEEFVDYSNYFPARSVIAWQDDAEFKNHTQLTSMKYGWSWNINLKHRAGNGYIYDSNYISEDEAIQEIEERFGNKINPVASFKFCPGILNKSWKNNVIAIGLSSGFLEPLESNGLASIVEQLNALTEYWAPNSNTIIEQDLYNNKNKSIMNDISDFLSLHYRGHRNDTAFWKDHNTNPLRISSTLQHRLDMWQEGIIGLDDTQGYGLENFMVVAQGLNLINKEKLKHRLLSKRSNIFEEFYQSYSILKRDVDNISNICYTIEEWDRIIYGNNQ